MPTVHETVSSFFSELGFETVDAKPYVFASKSVYGQPIAYVVRVEDRRSMSQLPNPQIYEQRLADATAQQHMPDDARRMVVVTEDVSSATASYSDFRRAMADRRIHVGTIREFFESFVSKPKISSHLRHLGEFERQGVQYVPQHVAPPPPSLEKQPALRAVLDWIADRKRNRLGLLHAPAAHGKTVFAERLAKELLATAEREPGSPIPFLIRYGDHHHVEDVDHLFLHALSSYEMRDLPVKALKTLIRRGRIVLIFDGLDELSEEAGDRLGLENVSKLAELIHKDSEGRVLVTCRSTFLGSGRTIQALLRESSHELWELLPFDEEDQRRFLDTNPPSPMRGAQVASHRDRVLTFIGRHPFLQELAGSPFLLKQISQAVADHPDHLPKNASEVYGGFLDSLCARELERQKHGLDVPTQVRFLKRLAHELVNDQAYSYPRELVQMVIEDELSAEISAAKDPKARRAELVGKLMHHAAFGAAADEQGDHSDIAFLHGTVRDFGAASHLLAVARGDSPAARLSMSALCRRRLPESVIAFLGDDLDRAGLEVLGALVGRTPSLLDNENVFRTAVGMDMQDAPTLAFPSRRCSGMDLSGLRVEDADLMGFTFAGCDLSRSVFSSCNLGQCDFRSSRLDDAVFDECDLHGAQFDARPGVRSVNGDGGADASAVVASLLRFGAIVGGERSVAPRDVPPRTHDAQALVTHVLRKFYVGPSAITARRRKRGVDVLERGRAGTERVLIRQTVTRVLEGEGLIEREHKGADTSYSVVPEANAEVISFLYRGVATDRIKQVIAEVERDWQA